MDTIYALATARGRAGVAVIRLSGPLAHQVIETLTGLPLPAERVAALRRIVWRDDLLDDALVMIFGAGRSFTGEPVAELHLHGSLAIVGSVLRILGEFSGVRLAEPGEFTRRALENGRLDLAQVEGLADLIDAETEAQRRQAFRVFAGHVGRKVEDWRRILLRIAALMEATIDFVEEDVPVDVLPEVRNLAYRLLDEMRAELAGAAVAERVRDGFEVAIVGVPNAGKSTLLNELAGRDAAITSDVAGTTRDIIEVRMDMRGLPVVLLDTAGLRETADPVEQIGVDRARTRAEAADLRIFLLETPQDRPILEVRPGDIVVLGKGDLWPLFDGRRISGKTGLGIDRLIDDIGAALAARTAGSSLLIRERHRIAISGAVRALEEALFRLDAMGDQIELAAESVRYGMRALDQLIGRIGVEDVLGEIFSSFCIGK
ncbi:MAG: tRNA uridine-5-carboxymethylaminomethyl(34) synthesis GTPase MnmE [Gemmobacter sp.]|jgi:tRNA modification GTPase|nr:tRNA uridine-5-carboxymethylaminomethyl(34) synthesis GTPase MnmE [Gemmobacter sp.]